MAGDVLPILIAFLLLFAVLTVPFMRLLDWWSDGAIDTTTAIACLLALLVLVGVVVTGSVALKFAAVVTILAGALLLPGFGTAHDKAALREIDDEQLQTLILRLEANAHDYAARITMAELLGKRGQYDEAIKHMEWVLQDCPRLRPTVRPRLDELKHKRDRPEHLGVIFCHQCHAQNPPGSERCSTCGALFSLGPGLAHGFQAAGGVRALLRGWIVCGIALPTIWLAILHLDAVYAAAIVLATVAVSAWLFLRWVGGDLGVRVD